MVAVDAADADELKWRCRRNSQFNDTRSYVERIFATSLRCQHNINIKHHHSHSPFTIHTISHSPLRCRAGRCWLLHCQATLHQQTPINDGEISNRSPWRMSTLPHHHRLIEAPRIVNHYYHLNHLHLKICTTS